MDSIVRVLKDFKLNKEIRMLVNNLNPRLNGNLNLSDVFLELYREDMIDAEHYIYLHTKLLLNRYCVIGEKLMEKHNIMVGVYLYDQQHQKAWVGGAPHIPQGYLEYSNGLSLAQDIAPGNEIPIYIRNIIAIDNVKTSKNSIALNHQDGLLSNGLLSFCCIPILHKTSNIGHIILLTSDPFDWRKLDTSGIFSSAQFLEEKLLDNKERFIRIASNQIK